MGGIRITNLLAEVPEQNALVSLSGDRWFGWQLKNFTLNGIAIRKGEEKLIADARGKLADALEEESGVNVGLLKENTPPESRLKIKAVEQSSADQKAEKYVEIIRSGSIKSPMALRMAISFMDQNKQESLITKNIVLPAGQRKSKYHVKTLVGELPDQLGSIEIRVIKDAGYRLEANSSGTLNFISD